MGSGTSTSSEALYDVASDLQFSHEQRQKYKTYYNELLAKGMQESNIREKLAQKFKTEKGSELTEFELRSISKITKTTKLNLNFDLKSVSTSSKGNDVQAPQSARVYKTNAILKEQAVKVSKDSAHKPETEIKEKSVEDDHKLKCTVCNTTFKTEILLERHVKYSYLHARAVEEQSSLTKKKERAQRIALIMHNSLDVIRKTLLKRNVSARGNPSRARWLWAYDKVKLNIAIAKTTNELVNFYRSSLKTQKPNNAKMLFDGSKLFWRTQESIDLNIYLHDDESIVNSVPNKSPVIEIVGFEVSKQKEMTRLYANFKVLQIHLFSRIESAVVEYRKSILKDGPFDKVVEVDNLEPKEITIMNKIITDYIISKLDIKSHPNRPTQKGIVLGEVVDEAMTNVLLKVKGESFRNNVINNSISPREKEKLATRDSGVFRDTLYANTTVPENALVDENLVLKLIQPVEIIRRRRTTEAERNMAFADFDKNTKELSNFTNRATQLASTTNVQPYERTGLKHDSSTNNLDDIVSRLAKELKDSQIAVNDILENSQKDSATATVISPKAAVTSPKGSNQQIVEKTIIVNNNQEDAGKKSYMKSTASQNPDGLSIVTKTIAVVHKEDGTTTSTVTAVSAEQPTPRTLASVSNVTSTASIKTSTSTTELKSVHAVAGSGFAAVKSIGKDHGTGTTVSNSARNLSIPGSARGNTNNNSDKLGESMGKKQQTMNSARGSSIRKAGDSSQPVNQTHRDAAFVLSQTSAHHQREDALALQEMIRSAHNSRANSPLNSARNPPAIIVNKNETIDEISPASTAIVANTDASANAIRDFFEKGVDASDRTALVSARRDDAGGPIGTPRVSSPVRSPVRSLNGSRLNSPTKSPVKLTPIQ